MERYFFSCLSAIMLGVICSPWFVNSNLLAQNLAELKLLNGQTITGVMPALTAEKITIRTSSGAQDFPIAVVQRLRFNLHSNLPNRHDSPISIGMIDGSRVTAQQFTGTSKEWKLVRSTSAKPSELATNVIPDAALHWLLFRSLTEEETASWNSILQEARTTDELVIGREGAAMDRIQGFIQSIQPDRIQFEFDGQVLDVPRSKLIGAIRLRKPLDRIQPAVKVHFRDGSLWLAASPPLLSISGDSEVSWKTHLGVPWQASLAEIAEIDFSSANVRWLAELAILERKTQTSAFSPHSSAARDELFSPRFVSLSSSTSSSYPDQDLVFSLPGEITFRVPDGFQQFQAKIGRSNQGDLRSIVWIEVWQNDEKLWENKLDAGVPAAQVQLHVQPEKRLRLVVRSTNILPIGTEITWYQPRLGR